MARFWTALIVATGWAGLCAAATPPPAPVTLPQTVVEAQERLVIRLDADGRPVVLDRQSVEGGPDAAPPSDFSKEQFTSARAVKPITAAADTMVATLWFDKGVTTLKVENGFDHPVSYVARLIARRGTQTLIRTTSTCPVRARGVSYDTWPDKIDGIAIDSFRVRAPGDLACTGDSGLPLTAKPAAAAPSPNACTVGNPVGGPPSVSVKLDVSPADGAIQSRSATWGVANAAGAPMPTVLLDYPVQKGAAASAPDHLSVFEAMSMKPTPPSPTASIVILVDGVEQTRRPWGLYAQAMAAIARGDKVPEFFVGLVPFNANGPDGRPDAGLQQVLAQIASGQMKMLEVEVVGARGGIMDRHRFPLATPPVSDPAILGPMLREAEAKAAGPGHCAAPAAAAR